MKLSAFIFIGLLGIRSQAQKEDSIHKVQGYSIIISLNQFNKIVDSCTQLLQTKNFSEISDSGNVYIIMCHNTLAYTPDLGSSSVTRYEGDRYDRFAKALFADNDAYEKSLLKIYTSKISHGGGLYFPKLNIQLLGAKDRHSIFGIIEQ
jgi:hypothetical protein